MRRVRYLTNISNLNYTEEVVQLGAVDGHFIEKNGLFIRFKDTLNMMMKKFTKVVKCLGMIVFLGTSSLIADEFPFKAPKNFTLNPKYIALHHPVATNQILGQLYFDQGLTFIYAFNHDAAYWSFLRASEVDPDMAMAYWGMALSLGSNINMVITPERAKVASELVQKALQKSANGPENEKDYIQALSQRYVKHDDTDQKQIAVRYSQAMEKLSKKYQDDPDAAVLYAESLLDVNPWNQWDLNGKPREGTMNAVRALQSVLKRMPNHLGANHYFIHAVEASNHPEIALMSAERLKTLLPSSGHILHMPSHIYLLVGDYEQAIESNLAAVVADREYIKQYGMYGIYPLHYLSHNMFFLSRAYTLQGRYDEAKQAADKLTDFYASHFHKMEDLEYYISAPLTVLITFHRWKEILELKKPQDDMQVTTALWYFGRALAFTSVGDRTQALNEQKRFLEAKNQIQSNQVFGYNKASQILAIAEVSLESKLAETEGNFDQAVRSLQKAVVIQDNLRYNEPPDWFYPIREALGGVYLRMNKPQEAEIIFRQELKRHPQNGRALFGLKESLKAQSRTSDSYWVNEEFQKAWQYSNISLSIQDL